MLRHALLARYALDAAIDDAALLLRHLITPLRLPLCLSSDAIRFADARHADMFTYPTYAP